MKSQTEGKKDKHEHTFSIGHSYRIIDIDRGFLKVPTIFNEGKCSKCGIKMFRNLN